MASRIFPTIHAPIPSRRHHQIAAFARETERERGGVRPRSELETKTCASRAGIYLCTPPFRLRTICRLPIKIRSNALTSTHSQPK